MQEAARRVQGAARLLEVEGRGSRLASLQRQLVARRCRLAIGYGAVYSVGPKRGLPLCPMYHDILLHHPVGRVLLATQTFLSIECTMSGVPSVQREGATPDPSAPRHCMCC